MKENVSGCFFLKTVYSAEVSEENHRSCLHFVLVYSLTSLSRPPLSRQPRFSPPVATGRIFFHVVYLVNSPASRLALANWWIDNDLCKLHSISRHSRLAVASLSVSLCQLQRLTVSVSVGRTEHVRVVISRSLNCGPVYGWLYPSLSLAWKSWNRAASSASGTSAACD